MIAPFYFKNFDERILITNDIGRYMFLNDEQFELLINDRTESDSELHDKLKGNMFVFDSSVENYIEAMKFNVRRGKSYMFNAPSLHIFVITNYCNSNCIYCQAQSSSVNDKKNMSYDVAKKSVDIAMQSPQKNLNFEFQGGEPLSNFEIIRYIVEYTEHINEKSNKNIRFSVVSNLTLLTDEMINFFVEHNISVSTSMDGNREVHNYNRPLSGCNDSLKIVKNAISRLKNAGIPCGAIETTTKKSLGNSKEIIDEYIAAGMKNVFVRALTPLGYALEQWDKIGYSTDEFLLFYKKCLKYIIEKNKQGIYMAEGHASIFLSKILRGYGLNYMELRSPCGAGIGQIAYYYNGDIYTCDEGRMLSEMGDDSFRMGNVYEDDYDSILESKQCKAVCKYSILESLPICEDCVYMPYCGTCPVLNYAIEGDLISRSLENYRCRLYSGMLDCIFELLSDDENRKVMETWI